MDIRSLEEEAQSLGFDSAEEMELFLDVCGTENDSPMIGFDDIEEVGYEYKRKTKTELIKYMKENDLVNLFNRVKDLPMYDRFIEIYNYITNELFISDRLLGVYNRKVEEAVKTHNKEQELKFRNKARELFVKMNIYINRQN